MVTGANVTLTDYACPNANDPTTVGEYEYWNEFRQSLCCHGVCCLSS